MRFHRHRWRIVFPALYGSQFDGYRDCRCGERDVRGPDAYTPYAWQWIASGTAPPVSRWPWRQFEGIK